MALRSISIAVAADLLDTSKPTIVQMLNKGELRGHYLRRERRVFVESIAEYQAAHAIEPKEDQPPVQAPKQLRIDVETEAAKTLKEFGL